MERYYDLLEYVADSLSVIDCEVERTIKTMDERRCPLIHASKTIVDRIDEAIKVWCEDNDIDYYNFDIYLAFEKDIEDIFWDAIELSE